ncbi:PWWP domain-containing protein [Caerostris darwini]|uniref:PWWP domain-containing protein n=1 Tax=Caerostris darwini TaxID=1538125 RepID=A0AAV4MHT3_9ARAC|nr:PWWP domain-containing protein [Caerostris darwini]
MDGHAAEDDLGGQAVKDILGGHAAEDDLGGQAVKDILGGHAAKDDLDGQAAKDDLGDHAVKDDLGSHAAEDDLNTTLIPGDLIWTKVGKHPFWPSMITYDPADGAYKKLTKSKGKNETIYHVQFFGTVQRGWTSPGSSFLFRGKNAYWEKVQLLEKTNPNIGPKSLKKLKLKYDVPLSAKNKWTVAVKEADEALKCLDQKERFETYVYKYNIKKKSLPKGKVAAKISAQSSKMKLSNISDEVCDICFGNNVDIFCTGKCSKFFHMACLGLFKKPSMFKCPTCYSGGISAASTEFTSVPVTLLSPTTVSPPELIAATVAPRELESTMFDILPFSTCDLQTGLEK